MSTPTRAPRARPTRHHPGGAAPVRARDEDGQALVEMAIVAPILFLLVGGIIQFGLIFWSEQTLTQIARDTGRWAATQTSCSDRAAVASTANTIAGNSSLFGYGSNWAASASDTSSSSEIVVDWDTISGSCPPADNQEVSYISITIDHQIPLFFPFVPGDGRLSTTAEFRMEPLPS